METSAADRVLAVWKAGLTAPFDVPKIQGSIHQVVEILRSIGATPDDVSCYLRCFALRLSKSSRGSPGITALVELLRLEIDPVPR